MHGDASSVYVLHPSKSDGLRVVGCPFEQVAQLCTEIEFKYGWQYGSDLGNQLTLPFVSWMVRF